MALRQLAREFKAYPATQHIDNRGHAGGALIGIGLKLPVHWPGRIPGGAVGALVGCEARSRSRKAKRLGRQTR